MTQNFLRGLRPGQVCAGAVTSVTDFGIFVDLGTASGVVTVANASWRKFNHLSEVAHVGQEAVGVVLSVDLDREQVSLSLKDLQPDPFVEFARTKFGSTVTGPVTKTAPVGIFVGLGDGFVGFLPKAEIDAYGFAPGIGHQLTVNVTYINVADRRIVLSLADDTDRSDDSVAGAY